MKISELTSKKVEQIVGHFLRTGKGHEVAGYGREDCFCPVAEALFQHKFDDAPLAQPEAYGAKCFARFSVRSRYVLLPSTADSPPMRVLHTPRVLRFIDYVDKMGGVVTKKDCRVMWRTAKEQTA